MFGGPKARGQRISHGLVISRQYVNGEEALVIWPHRKRTLGAGAYVMCLSAAWKYDDHRYLLSQAGIAAKVMGMDPLSRFDVVSICTVLDEAREELLMMQPEPEAEMVQVGEGSMVASDGTRFHFPILKEQFTPGSTDGED
jgi:hypothetical protein